MRGQVQQGRMCKASPVTVRTQGKKQLLQGRKETEQLTSFVVWTIAWRWESRFTNGSAVTIAFERLKIQPLQLELLQAHGLYNDHQN